MYLPSDIRYEFRDKIMRPPIYWWHYLWHYVFSLCGHPIMVKFSTCVIWDSF